MAIASSSYEPLSQNDDLLPVASQQARTSPKPRSSLGFTTAATTRPPIYYGEGNFSAPSSEDEEEDQELLEKRRNALRHNSNTRLDDLELDIQDTDYLPPYEGFGDDNGLVVGGGKQRTTPLRYLLIALCSLVLLAVLIGILAAHSYNGTLFRPQGVKPLTMDHVFNGTFGISRSALNWVPEAGDGIFSTSENGNIVLRDLKTNSSKVLVKRSNVKDEHGTQLYWGEWKLSPDMKHVLLKADVQKQWRHSSFGNYYIYNLESDTTRALTPPTSPPVVAYATWSPTGESIAYVSNNDLYVLPSPKEDVASIRVTANGNSSLFNGVPDWVYEEEVFGKDFALWWSPDSQRVAFLRLDETKVETFTFPIYNPTGDNYSVQPYTRQISMKYPKPGYNNPLVSLHIFQLDAYSKSIKNDENHPKVLAEAALNATIELTWEGKRKPEDSIIMEVAWVGNQTLIAKEVNRAANDGGVVFFDLKSDSFAGGKGRVVRKLGKAGEQGDDGWIDSEQAIYPLQVKAEQSSAYLDIVPTKEGYNHIALFSPADSSVPRFLTSGKWEVADGIKAVDYHRGLVYFVAANQSTERHLYSIPLPTTQAALPTPAAEPTALTDRTLPAWYSAHFSPQAGYYLLGYEGPNVPWQKVISIENSTLNYVLNDNKALNTTSATYQAPIISRLTMDSDGFELNAMEIRPHDMDDSGRVRYPVLFRVYGGPASQMVHNRFERDWHHYLACSLKYIVVVVDGRGTGWKGRKLRNTVRNNLGFFETKDQINAARLWATKRYVDTKRIGIWGWSYGGFMTSKVMEANAGIHTLGMAVAPVTSWKLYDSIYTERYMDLPSVNPGGYVNASISNVTGFHNVNYLLAHGSGDDNVHFANSAHLLDMFTADQVRDYRFRMFTDSDHSISKRGAYRELFEWMTSFLVEKWGKGGTRRSG